MKKLAILNIYPYISPKSEAWVIVSFNNIIKDEIESWDVICMPDTFHNTLITLSKMKINVN